MTTCIPRLNCLGSVKGNIMEDEKAIKETTRRLDSGEKFNEACDLLQQMEKVDKERGYRRVILPVRARRRRLILWRGVAASAVVLVALTLLIGKWNQLKEKAVMPLASTTMDSIVPGQRTARLVLADRREVLLDTLSSSRVALSPGVMIHKDGKEVTYEVVDAQPAVKTEYNELIVPRGGEYDIVLEDGTKVWMNADSKLRYPVMFHGGERRVYLEGEAYFEVARDTSRPFFVETSNQQIRVLGTAFNVCAYPDEALNYAVLVRGSVGVEDKQTGADRVLRPGEQVTLNVETGESSVQLVNAAQVIAWKDGMFVFDGQTLEQIMAKLARWYNVTVFFRNPEAKELVFKGNLPRYGDFQLVLDILEKSSNVKFNVSDHVVTVNL